MDWARALSYVVGKGQPATSYTINIASMTSIGKGRKDNSLGSVENAGLVALARGVHISQYMG